MAFLAIAMASAAGLSHHAARVDEKAVAARSHAFAKAAMDADLTAFSAFMSDDYLMSWPEPPTNGERAHWATKTKAE
jgi:hypothetical protein